MRQYERDLKKLLELTENGAFPIHEDDTGISEEVQRKLVAKGLIVRHPAGDNKYSLVVDDGGITYFEDKTDRRIRYLLNNWIAFLAMIVAVISLIRTF